jgi:hypothetical protein
MDDITIFCGSLFFATKSSATETPHLNYLNHILPYDLAPYSHHTTWQTALKYTQLFDLIHEISGYPTPTLYPADAAWSQLSKKRIISDQGYVRLEKIAAACDEPARNWDFGQKIVIFQSNLLHRALIQNRPKQVKMSISPIAQGFLKKFRVQHVALTARRPKHPCLVWCNPLFLY